MDTPSFTADLARKGYTEIATRTIEAHPINNAHTHDWTTRGLVTAGTFTITIDGRDVAYRPDMIFEVARGVVHHETTGPDGTTITTGRRYV